MSAEAARVVYPRLLRMHYVEDELQNKYDISTNTQIPGFCIRGKISAYTDGRGYSSFVRH